MEEQINMNQHLINDLIRQKECLTIWIERLKGQNEKLSKSVKNQKLDQEVNSTIQKQKVELLLSELFKTLENN